MLDQRPAPYWRLSGFYLFYFATLGAFMPYWGLYLQYLHFSPQEIGELLATVAVSKIIAPNVWGWIADRTGARMAIVRWGCLCALLAFGGVFFVHDYWPLLLVSLLYGFFWNAALPQLEATTFNHLGSAVHRYSSIRVWGSIGFIAAVLSLGPVLEQWGAGILPSIQIVLVAGILLASLWVPEHAVAAHHSPHESLRALLQKRAVVALLVVSFLMQVSHGPYYTFYSIYLEAHHYSRSEIGALWSLGVIAEVIVFLFMHRLIPRFGLRRLLLWSAALTTLRWITIGAFVDSTATLVAAQILHAASFGIFHAGAIQLIHHYFSGIHQGRGQALYSSLSFGAGGALGSFYAGYAWGSLGELATFLIGAFFSAIALVVIWRYIAPSSGPASENL